MKEYLSIIQRCPLFRDVSQQEMGEMLHCLNGAVRLYQKDEIIWMAGESIDRMGIVVEGTVRVIRDDVFGNRHILTDIAPGQLFGEAFVCAGVKTAPVTVIAREQSKVLFVEFHKLMTTCRNSCAYHNQLIFNMLSIIAQKNILLNKKMSYVTAKSTRNKIAMYLADIMEEPEQKSVRIPFNRNDLAEFLDVNRSVLSRQLSQMKSEGIIDMRKNVFYILQPDVLADLAQ